MNAANPVDPRSPPGRENAPKRRQARLYYLSSAWSKARTICPGRLKVWPGGRKVHRSQSPCSSSIGFDLETKQDEQL